ncbi:hypothetical protein J8I87_06165 [Paraburkholderia sp. LEh10]|uniref:hypothetical protein n=1 Tax=Paraburkholderia sp. LEh10 TaxID=2821353 RepID=UPI001AE799C6|nr:hypothetical protein [Paraburkholderia sp. LEh10]MBP0589309.1 hypothetical protein [Paraburkholderia sp. LEh10]
MDAKLILCLVVLAALLVGVALGFMFAGMDRAPKNRQDADEHECNAPYRRFDE